MSAVNTLEQTKAAAIAAEDAPILRVEGLSRIYGSAASTVCRPPAAGQRR